MDYTDTNWRYYAGHLGVGNKADKTQPDLARFKKVTDACRRTVYAHVTHLIMNAVSPWLRPLAASRGTFCHNPSGVLEEEEGDGES